MQIQLSGWEIYRGSFFPHGTMHCSPGHLHLTMASAHHVGSTGCEPASMPTASLLPICLLPGPCAVCGQQCALQLLLQQCCTMQQQGRLLVCLPCWPLAHPAHCPQPHQCPAARQQQTPGGSPSYWLYSRNKMTCAATCTEERTLKLRIGQGNHKSRSNC